MVVIASLDSRQPESVCPMAPLVCIPWCISPSWAAIYCGRGTLADSLWLFLIGPNNLYITATVISGQELNVNIFVIILVQILLNTHMALVRQFKTSQLEGQVNFNSSLRLTG